MSIGGHPVERTKVRDLVVIIHYKEICVPFSLPNLVVECNHLITPQCLPLSR